ncbi:hypothetical protein HanXRQr2_Chr17g0798441 [Helianthus annuus]|uniref:Uncharacterized protein n=1 Tax=Helianthus annuus TaxID=4232 RepID=A0A9K3GUA6_HELAN|nr:hypothetical protein HanXRQr2_Chr17g0798441 [Helianthus annuus]
MKIVLALCAKNVLARSRAAHFAPYTCFRLSWLIFMFLYVAQTFYLFLEVAISTLRK